MIFQKTRNKLEYLRNSQIHQHVSSLSKLESCTKSDQDLLRHHSFLIPPPPPPPLMNQRIQPFTTPKQRTAQQKIYEFKHQKSFGNY